MWINFKIIRITIKGTTYRESDKVIWFRKEEWISNNSSII